MGRREAGIRREPLLRLDLRLLQPHHWWIVIEGACSCADVLLIEGVEVGVESGDVDALDGPEQALAHQDSV